MGMCDLCGSGGDWSLVAAAGGGVGGSSVAAGSWCARLGDMATTCACCLMGVEVESGSSNSLHDVVRSCNSTHGYYTSACSHLSGAVLRQHAVLLKHFTILCQVNIIFCLFLTFSTKLQAIETNMRMFQIHLALNVSSGLVVQVGTNVDSVLTIYLRAARWHYRNYDI